MKLALTRKTHEICAFCKDGFSGFVVASTRCAGCGTRYHPECLNDELAGVCAVFGCGHQVVSFAPADRTRCAVCDGGISGAVYSCPQCLGRHHLGCLGVRCATRGCNAPVVGEDRGTWDHPAPLLEAEIPLPWLVGVLTAVVFLLSLLMPGWLSVGTVLLGTAATWGLLQTEKA